MNNAGNNTTCGAVVRTFCPAESIEPTLDIVELSKLIIPKYDKDVSLKMTPGITSTEPVIIVPIEFGKICRHIMRISLAPSVRAASTYS